MAPTPPKPSVAGKARTKLPKSVRPPSQSVNTRSTARDVPQTTHDRLWSSQSSLSGNKRDKRQIKHSLLLARLKGTQNGGRIQKKRVNLRENKRRRTNLTSILSDLRDVLPDDDTEGRRANVSHAAMAQGGLKTRPGHTKRLSRLKEAEMDRFKKNMAAMSEGPGKQDSDVTPGSTIGTDSGTQAQASDQQSARWAALRAHIASQQT